MASVHDVAAYVVEAFDRPVSTMKLQKLVYLSQGWSLALRNRPMFIGEFEAWANGPVNRTLFRHHRTEYSVSRWRLGNPDNLDEDEQSVVDAVLDNYGALSGAELSDLTHVSGTPWARARERAGADEGQPAQEALSDDDIREHFQELLLSRRP